MTELSIYNDTDRVLFPAGKQTIFFLQVRKKAGMNWSALARALDISLHLLLDYRKEKYLLPYRVLRKGVLISKISFPKNVTIMDQNWSKGVAGRLGGQALFEKYGKVGGDENHRKNQWRKWWNTTGRNNPNKILARKDIQLPSRSVQLAELFGILIGDGGITKYQMTITLNGETDKAYSEYVVTLLHILFDIYPKIYRVKNSKAVNIVISRSNLINFLAHNGLKIGHKINQGISVPDWIMKSKKYKISCLRGLIDTDGSVVLEKHILKEKKEYIYPRLNFTSASPSLVQQVMSMLIEIGFNPKIRRQGRSVQLENLTEICQYFDIVGSSNPKHLERAGAWYKKIK